MFKLLFGHEEEGLGYNGLGDLCLHSLIHLRKHIEGVSGEMERTNPVPANEAFLFQDSGKDVESTDVMTVVGVVGSVGFG